LTACF